MANKAVSTTSVWAATAAVPNQAPLTRNLEADVCVVGAGIAGMTTAFLLEREGKSVIVIDDGPVGGGETSLTTAHLSNALDDHYFNLEKLHGEQGARLAAQSHTAALDRIEKIVSKEKIICHFERVDGYLFASPEESIEELERELAAAHRAGLTDVQRIERAPLDGLDTGPCLQFPRQAQFHPLKYLAGLARAIERDGGRIFVKTHATKITGGPPARVETVRGARVTSDAIVVATNTPINLWVAVHPKQAAYRTYVIAGLVPHGSVAKALFWDTDDPYHYVRIQPVGTKQRNVRGQTVEASDLLIVGGEDHKTGQPRDADPYSKLEAWARQRFSAFGEILYRWSGQVMESVDGLAYIGRTSKEEPNVYIATGDSGTGMTHGTIAGMLLTDLILGRGNPWAELYDPKRITLRAGKEFIRENLNFVTQYADRITSGEVDSVRKIAPHTGGIIRRGLEKVAVYRDAQGKLHQRSAVCPHLGCVVAWNAAEKTWDCPCHGSRFDAHGKVLNGPANVDLPSV